MNSLTESLAALMPSSTAYPNGMMEPLTPFILGRAFFPGGSGLFGGSTQAVPNRPIMIVGQDFGDRPYVSALSERGSHDEDLCSTWEWLLRTMLVANQIDPRDCFFTNALLGVRCAAGIDTPNAALDDNRYVQACSVFMLEQIRLVRPSVIVALGVVPATLVARWLSLAPCLRAPRHLKRPTIAEVDAAGIQFVENVGVPGADAVVAFGWSVHPANSGPNLRHRRWPARGVEGRAANDLVWRCAAIAREKLLRT